MIPITKIGISPWPWKHTEDSGYDRESGDYNSTDCVEDANGLNLVCQMNGESVGDPFPNAEADCTMMAAAPELYEALSELLSAIDHYVSSENGDKFQRLDNACMKSYAALVKAGGKENNQDV